MKGNISNCINYADINSISGGGIVAHVAGQHIIYNCKNYGNVIGGGGIVGGSNGIPDWPEFNGYYNEILDCANYGNISRQERNYCGGIAGFFVGKISNCCNKGEISNTGDCSGGIVGIIYGEIMNCYNINSVIGTTNVGGIVGANGEGNINRLERTIENCYSIGNIEGITNVGNIVGFRNGGFLVNCYETNNIFTPTDLGPAFKDNPENSNQPLLYWE